MTESRHTNRLARETSPYLLQHAHNPVDWYPWGPEALDCARRERRPILLSIGYAACHWCHVMERESFENDATAALMNELFVCIKVDREERPDVDDIYMRAVQMMTGRGGWPLTAFLTPELEPFYGGTYYPPEDRHGMPSFRRVLEGVAGAWRDRRDEVVEMAGDLRDRVVASAAAAGGGARPTGDLVQRGTMELHDRFDPNHGGFGSAPKFPHSTSISLMLRTAEALGDENLRAEPLLTLREMAAGGIYDQLRGGFHRYSVDAEWLVPHFEKMLYDNALLIAPYLEAWQQTGDPEMARVVRETLDWVGAEMQSEEGGYYCTLDADSEGVEGRFYVWTRAEVREVLGDDSELFELAYDVSASGNWEGHNILHLPRSLEATAQRAGFPEGELRRRLQRYRERLLERRATRVRPGLDDKVLADWNGLMIAAMARAGRVLGEPRYVESARRAAAFIVDRMVDDERLLHTYRDGRAHLLAYLDDYAAMACACVELFLATSEWRWLRHGRHFADGMIALFWDDEEGGFFFTGSDHEELIARTKNGSDGATPSGNALAATCLQRLGKLLDERRYEQHAFRVFAAFEPQIRRLPSAFGQMLLALDEHLAEPREIVVVGRDGDARRTALERLLRRYAPHETVLCFDPEAADAEMLGQLPILSGRGEHNDLDTPTFHLCRRHVCEAPTQDLDTLLADHAPEDTLPENAPPENGD